MQVSRSVITLALVGLLAAACGGTPATGGPGGGNPTSGPAGTDGTAPTQGGGGGGGGGKPAGWDQYGKVHIEIAGPVQKSGDYGFIPAGSVFGGDAGSAFNFTIDGSSEIVSILIDREGKVVVSYGGEDFTAPAAECTTSNWNIGSSSASGTFDCAAAMVITASGAALQGATLKGSFDAHT